MIKKLPMICICGCLLAVLFISLTNPYKSLHYGRNERELHVASVFSFFELKVSCGFRMESDVDSRLILLPTNDKHLEYARFSQKEFYSYKVLNLKTGRFTGVYVDVSAFNFDDGKNCVSAFYVRDQDEEINGE